MDVYKQGITCACFVIYFPLQSLVEIHVHDILISRLMLATSHRPTRDRYIAYGLHYGRNISKEDASVIINSKLCYELRTNANTKCQDCITSMSFLLV